MNIWRHFVSATIVIFGCSIHSTANSLAPANDALCDLNIAGLLNLRETVNIKVTDAIFSNQKNEIIVNISGLPSCVRNLKMGFDINQDEARRFISRPTIGPVLMLQKTNEGHYTILAERELVDKLKIQWQHTKNLSTVVGHKVRLEFFSMYTAGAVLDDYSMPEYLQKTCRRGLRTNMTCGNAGADGISQFSIETLPSCTNPEWLKIFGQSITVADPFASGQDPQTNVSAVVSNDCHIESHKTPFAFALANTLIFDDQTAASTQVSVQLFSVVRLNAGLSWPK